MSRYPISCVVDSEVGAISKISCVVYTKKICAVIIALVEHVEKIKSAIEKKKGVSLSDVRTEDGTYCIAIFVSYMDTISALIDGKLYRIICNVLS